MVEYASSPITIIILKMIERWKRYRQERLKGVWALGKPKTLHMYNEETVVLKNPRAMVRGVVWW
jgi:hypothetical protein